MKIFTCGVSFLTCNFIYIYIYINHTGTLLNLDYESRAGVKLTNIVQQCGLTKVEPFDIPSQQCGNVCDQHDYTKFVFWFLSNISAQQMCA